MNNKATATKIPKLRFPEFQNAPMWEEKQLMDICIKIVQGGTPNTLKDDYWNGSIDWLTPTEMGKKETCFIYSTTRKITKKGLQNCSSDLLPINSVIISTRAPIGYLAINKSKMAINQGCKGLIPKNNHHYIFLFYSLFHFKTLLIDLGAGNTFKELSSNSLRSFKIPVPKLPEQKKIADCLTSLDDIITQQSQKLDTLKAHKKGLMQQLFPANGKTTPKLRFPEFSGEWQERKLENIFSGRRGQGLSKSDIDNNGQNKCILYGELYTIYSEVIDKVVSRTNLNIGIKSKVGDLLVPCSTTTTNIDLANVTVINENNVLLGSDISILRFKNNGNSIFFAYYLTHHKRLDLAKYGQGSTIVHLYYNHFKKMYLCIPTSVYEQQKIADCLTSLDDIITQQSQKLNTLKAHKKGLMQQLFPNIDEH